MRRKLHKWQRGYTVMRKDKPEFIVERGPRGSDFQNVIIMQPCEGSRLPSQEMIDRYVNKVNAVNGPEVDDAGKG
jgi:hypothetical protein